MIIKIIKALRDIDFPNQYQNTINIEKFLKHGIKYFNDNNILFNKKNIKNLKKINIDIIEKLQDIGILRNVNSVSSGNNVYKIAKYEIEEYLFIPNRLERFFKKYNRTIIIVSTIFSTLTIEIVINIVL